jgi:hypothetical protein
LRFCFKTADAADAFRARFGGERVTIQERRAELKRKPPAW